jgi:hypothetical protein
MEASDYDSDLAPTPVRDAKIHRSLDLVLIFRDWTFRDGHHSRIISLSCEFEEHP